MLARGIGCDQGRLQGAIGDQGHVTADGVFSWMEVECLGACFNAPMMQIGKDYYEDLDTGKAEAIFAALRRGEQPKPGPQNARHSSEPIGGAMTLRDVPHHD